MKKYKIIKSTTNSNLKCNEFYINNIYLKSRHFIPSLSNVDLIVTEYSNVRLTLQNSHITVRCKLIES